MSLFDKFVDPPEEEPEEQSLMEEAAQFAPAPWQPVHVEPEGITPLPEDFPVLDPSPRRRTVQKVIDSIERSAGCERKNCALDDRKVLIDEASRMIAEAVGHMQMACMALYAHGETMAAEDLIDRLAGIAEDVMRPLCKSVGLDTEIAGELDDD